MTLNELARAVESDKALQAALGRIKPQVAHGIDRLLATTFREMISIEHADERVVADQLNEACWDVAVVAFRHFDAAGLGPALGRHAKQLENFGFVENLPSMMFDHTVMVERLGVPHDKAMQYWHHVDKHRGEVIRVMSAAEFRFEPLAATGRRGFVGKGERWMHMSPRIWVRMAGAALIVANVVGSLGIGTGLAIASGVAGGGGVLIG